MYVVFLAADSRHLRLEPQYSVYDAPSYSPSRWLHLNKAQDGAAVLQYNSTIPPPGAPHRWRLPTDYTGLYDMAA